MSLYLVHYIFMKHSSNNATAYPWTLIFFIWASAEHVMILPSALKNVLRVYGRRKPQNVRHIYWSLVYFHLPLSQALLDWTQLAWPIISTLYFLGCFWDLVIRKMHVHERKGTKKEEMTKGAYWEYNASPNQCSPEHMRIVWSDFQLLITQHTCVSSSLTPFMPIFYLTKTPFTPTIYLTKTLPTTPTIERMTRHSWLAFWIPIVLLTKNQNK